MAKSVKGLKSGVIKRALKRLGQELGGGKPIELTIVGGAAGLLAGLLPESVTTTDVDAVNFRPARDVDSVLKAAAAVAEEMSLSGGWLNIEAGLFVSAIPAGWRKRRVDLGLAGRLHLFAVGRLDLIAMKFYAHREVDFEHLAKLRVTDAELERVDRHLRALTRKLPGERSRVEMAVHVVGHWRERA